MSIDALFDTHSTEPTHVEWYGLSTRGVYFDGMHTVEVYGTRTDAVLFNLGSKTEKHVPCLHLLVSIISFVDPRLKVFLLIDSRSKSFSIKICMERPGLQYKSQYYIKENPFPGFLENGSEKSFEGR